MNKIDLSTQASCSNRANHTKVGELLRGLLQLPWCIDRNTHHMAAMQNSADCPEPVKDIQGDGRWMSQVILNLVWM